MLSGQRQMVRTPAGSRTFPHGKREQKTVGDDPERLRDVEPLVGDERWNLHSTPFITVAGERKSPRDQSDPARNIAAGQHQDFTRHQHDSFVRTAAGFLRQAGSGGLRDVGPDDGVVAGLQLEDGGAVSSTDAEIGGGTRSKFS